MAGNEDEPFPRTFELGPACPKCARAVEVVIGLEYFSGTQPSCSGCSERLDWFEVLSALLREGEYFSRALSPAGARWTLAMITIHPGVNFSLDLTSHGVPETARILSISYTPQGGGLFPIEIHGNTPTRNQTPKRMLVPIRPSPASEVGPTKVAVMAVWVPQSDEDNEWFEFVHALEAHANGDYSSAVVPASAAVESAITRLLARVFLQLTSRGHVERFQREVGFSHQLNVILPTVASLLGLPVLPPAIRGATNRLRTLRNEIAHGGKPEEPITKEESASCLAGALLVRRYARLLADAIDARRF